MGKTTAETIVRPMTAADLEAVQTIERSSFHDAWTLETLLGEVNSTLATYLVLAQADEVVGYAGFWLIAGEAQVTRVAVAPARRGLGLGKLLTEAMVEAAWKCGASAITLEVRESNLSAQKAYEAAGFKNLGVRPHYYQDNQEDAIIMWLYPEAE